MELIHETLQRITVGPEISFENLALFPLLDAKRGARDYLTLREALAAGTVRVMEKSETGSVTELMVVNDADRPVLLLDGEQLVGAKQNRILNVSILVPARQSLVIPVSCVEAGRWRYERAGSQFFSDSDLPMHSSGRARKMADVHRSMGETGQHRSDQGAVWNDIGFMLGDMGIVPPTGAMNAIHEKYRDTIEGYVRAFPATEGQVGALFAVNGKLLGFDVFDSADALKTLLDKLVRSYAVDALDRRAEPATRPSRADAEALLQATASAEAEISPAVGMGEEVRLKEPTVFGTALVADERVIHLAAFRADAAAGRVRPKRGGTAT